ncbi:tigger transposable element-derived protein 4 isoform X3 [Panthera tigris]|uniref:tigger transposable element-derived protein 4 isoform X3 n=1 Tax=Panthera tigris TaxID=9694 RepID=UPI001C6F8C89|nr:tigger transposable element-derived protein 4 isoform X3 [Panthera tigris]
MFGERRKIYHQVLEGVYHFLLYPEETWKLMDYAVLVSVPAPSLELPSSSNLMHDVKLCISMEANKKCHWDSARDTHIPTPICISVRLTFHESQLEEPAAARLLCSTGASVWNLFLDHVTHLHKLLAGSQASCVGHHSPS